MENKIFTIYDGTKRTSVSIDAFLAETLAKKLGAKGLDREGCTAVRSWIEDIAVARGHKITSRQVLRAAILAISR